MFESAKDPTTGESNSGAAGGGSCAAEPTGDWDAARRARSLLETYLLPASGGGAWGGAGRGAGRGGGGGYPGYGGDSHRGRFGGGGATEGRAVAGQLGAGVASASSSEAAP